MPAERVAVTIEGPLPADTVFVRAMRGEFDAVIACYHDQGLIPVKLVAFGRAVNVTLGLPIIRTSVDHGTAFDIAGRGIADASSLVHAVLAGGASRRCRGVIVRLALAAVILFYAVLGLVVLAPESVYSGDIGVKFVQARALGRSPLHEPRHSVSR